MDRRSAIKNISMGVGYTLAAPTLMSIFQSCNKEPDWIPVYLSAEQAAVITKLVDIILPANGDIPGAVAVGVPQFIDLFYGEVYSPKAKGEFDLGFQAFKTKFLAGGEDADISDAKPEALEGIIKPYFNITKEDRIALQEKLAEGYSDSEEPYVYDTDTAAANFLIGLRGAAIWGWRTSEQVGENVLTYEPIPGVWKACIPVEEVGRPYSL
jgi:hypothetical protein